MRTQLRAFLFYVAFVAVSIGLIGAVLQMGPTRHDEFITMNSSWTSLFSLEISRNIASPLTGLILQILTILVFSRLCSLVVKRIGQPQVIGEMIAGLVLGKSVFAVVWPDGFHWLFPASSLPPLFLLSQIGLILFMFVIGLHLKVSELKSRGSAALVISHASIVVPFFLGTVLAVFIYPSHGPKNFEFVSFALFMGIAMSITAFPVLARILQEKEMTTTPLGVLTLTCAAIDDVTAWCVLAAVIGLVKAGSLGAAAGVLLSAVAYVAIMFKLVRPTISRLLNAERVGADLTSAQLGVLLIVLLGSALISEVIGIHALFGAFLAGVIMPQNLLFRNGLMEKIEDLTAVVLLPIFFVYTGLRTQIALLNSASAWILCGSIVALAIVGKILGSAMAARWSGLSWRDSWAIGTLMNTRGLMELIVLNIGYDLGILAPDLFAMMIIMAIVTTLMTTPCLNALNPPMGRRT